MKLTKIKWHHYINYIVIGIITAVLTVMTLTGNRLPNSTLFLLEKIAISMILTLIAGLIPSRIASKKDPVVALRTE